MMKKSLKEFLIKMTGRSDIVIDMPPNPEMGDYSTAVSFQIGKAEKRSPVEVARELVLKIDAHKPSFIERVEATGPYINFFINLKEYSKSVLDAVFSCSKDYGKLSAKRKKVIVEHTSVNPNKPLHMGAARNSILGDSLANVLAAAGYDVEVENYIDDLGIQFAEVFWGVLKYGDKIDEKYDHFLGKLYIKVQEKKNDRIENEIKELNKKLEIPSSGEAQKARHVVEKCLASQLESLKKIGIFYDVLIWESDIVHSGLLKETFEKMRKSKDIVVEKEGEHEGCLVMKLGRIFPKMKNPDKVLVRSDKTPTYTAKDIALQMWKFGLLSADLKYEKWDERTMTSSPSGEKMDFGRGNIVINVIGSEQSYPQEIVKLALKVMGYEKQYENAYHMAYEFVTLPDDTFSGRRGTWIGFTLDDVIAAGEKKALEEVEKRRSELSNEARMAIASAIASGSVRYNIIKYAPEKKIVFKWRDALNLEGDSCPYIQYAHARCCSILKKTKGIGKLSYDYSHPKERELLKILAEMPGVVKASAKDMRPHYITKYVNEVATRFNSFYNELPVLKSDKREDRLALVEATRIVLANCLRLLGITPLEEM
ncbi:MAG: arginine--tRNA ligase [Candidatus Methanofastidiosia archaeon]